jgi:hypothetical protein
MSKIKTEVTIQGVDDRRDILQLKNVVPHCSKIYECYDSTGCCLCASGVQEEIRKTGTNRFITMRTTHPRLHRLALPAFGIDKVLDYRGGALLI